MKSTFYFLIKPKAKRYNNTKKIRDKEIILNTEIFSHQYISRQGIIVGLPTQFNTCVNIGDEVIVHHNVFRRWHNARGKEKNSSSYIKENLYKIDDTQIYAYKSNNKWKALPGYTFVKPLDDLIGEVQYSDKYKKGDIVGYRPSGEYEFMIDDDKLYRLKTNFITIKYESKPEEKENNRSWIQSS
jgi:hypothetical protein